MPGEDVTITLKDIRNLQGEWMMPFSYAFHFRTRAMNGTGIFTRGEEVNLPHTPLTLASGDFDLDGELDLIAASSHSTKNRYGTSDWISILLLKNDAKKGFILTPPQEFLHLIQGLAGGYSISEFLLVDYDLTGDLGIILTTNYGALKIKQTELGSGLLKELETIETPCVVLAGDINTDGFPDLITRTNASEIRFFQNFMGNFTGLLAGINVEDISYRLAIGDWNNDSYLDLAVTQPKLSKLLVYMNNGGVEFSFKNTLENVDSAKDINAANIDGDADIDLVLSNGNVLLNNGQGKFSHGIPFNFNGDKIELGDIDGDGDLDVVGISKDSLIVLKNNSEGIFSRFSGLALENHPNSLVIGDWDIDGDLDIAVAYDESNIISIFKNDFTPTEIPGFALEQNFPNPCSKSTYFFYTLPENINVTLSIYNISGELVTQLFSSYQKAGKHLISWMPGSVSSGIYFFQVRTSKGTKNIKFSVVK
jgi:hypothetical protein